ncbi:MAG: 3'-5' exonuclease, partial [Bacteroidota bacterium]
VYLIDALDGVIPSEYAVKSQEELDEERRLLYVALTRAERELFVSYPAARWRRGSGSFLTRVSRFLDGAPEVVLERVALVEEASGEALPEGDARGQLGEGQGQEGEGVKPPRQIGP